MKQPNAPSWFDDLTAAFRRTQSSEAARKFYERFPLGSIWQRNVEDELNPLIFSNRTATEKIHAIQETVLYSVNIGDAESQKLSYACWKKYLEGRFGDWRQKAGGLQESEYYREALTFTADDTRCSLDFLRKLNVALEAIDRFGIKQGSRVFELGSGFGQLARMFQQICPGSQYVALDLPESLYFCALYLYLTCPNSKIVWVEDPATLPSLLSGPDRPDAVLIPCIFGDQIASTGLEADVFINTSSLGEMNNKSSEYYLKLIQKNFKPKNAILLNRLYNTYDPLIEPERTEENGWYFYLDDKWNVKHWELEPYCNQIPYAEMFHTREVFWIASRSAETVAPVVPENIYKEAWYIGFTLRGSVRLANQLVFNTGMGSVLHHLSEAVRSAPTQKNVDALIKYLFVIRKPVPFEELPLLFALYRRLAGTSHELERPEGLGRKLLALLHSVGLGRIGLSIARKLPPSMKNTLYQMLFKEDRGNQTHGPGWDDKRPD
jgi:putative sugar O-methyltransferase